MLSVHNTNAGIFLIYAHNHKQIMMKHHLHTPQKINYLLPWFFYIRIEASPSKSFPGHKHYGHVQQHQPERKDISLVIL